MIDSSGVTVEISPDGDLGVVGTNSAVAKLTPHLVVHKADLLKALEFRKLIDYVARHYSTPADEVEIIWQEGLTDLDAALLPYRLMAAEIRNEACSVKAIEQTNAEWFSDYEQGENKTAKLSIQSQR